MIRTHLVKALYRDLLGPKNGYDETIEQPFAKYQVGVLTSCFHSEKIDDKIISDPLEKSFEQLPSKSQEYVESTQESDVPWPDTELDLDGSFTLGLSFVVSGTSPKIRICSTWGRYSYSDKLPANLKVFERNPNYYLTEWIDVKSFETNDKTIKLVSTSSGNIVTMLGAELHLRATKSEFENKWTIQVFLVNRTPFPDRDKDGNPKRQDEIHRIFQPQIRINADTDSVIEYLGDSSDNDEYSLLYSKRRTKARGFQCGAVWDDVDPEGHDAEFRKFTWPDKNCGLIPKDVLDDFTCPHLRTDYLPPYSILQPETSSKRYDAEYLSNQWDADSIEKYLHPIEEKYSEWINQQREYLMTSTHLSTAQKQIGKKNLDACEASLSEIKEGRKLVCSDERARLAFCFMNSVMSEKRMNEQNEKLEWLEFQMAFILQSLRGVTGTDKQMQELVDVLWFPTGGGKTEAYLGITMFAMAYRRLMSKDVCYDGDEYLNNDGGVNVISRYTLRLLTIQQFQRALGAISESDLRRIANWIPKQLNSRSLDTDELNKKFLSGSLWGKTRFSIGLWIGGDSTPTRFAYQTGGNKGRTILNAEGVLLSDRDDLKYRSYHEPPKGDPAQIQNCPVCKNLLAFPQNTTNYKSTTSGITWIVKTKKTISDLQSIPKSDFERSNQIELKKNPEFQELGKSHDGFTFFRVTMSLKISKSIENIRNTIDGWWDDFVNPLFVTKGTNSLTSTRASMPGYFFLKRSGDNRPYDFTIHCTEKNCKLNKTSWSEGTLQKNPDIPEPFLEKGTKNISTSVPISAFTVDEQVYSRCPTFIIATADKFANLPWDPRCASLFGNIDCKHNFFGFGRKSIFESPLLETKKSKSVRIVPDQSELHNVDRFLPPSLIIQDELHLIEGPLGSMVGVYEMALDALCRKGDSGPKYIASSATIKEAEAQIRTIFRKDINIFPRPGISSSDNFFAKTEEDSSCEQDSPGRLYVGICSAKSVFELPIKVCAIMMSEIHKIRENPESYGIAREDLEKHIDPYWTYVSYFSDLQLMSRFGGFYNDDIERDVKKFSPPRIVNGKITNIEKFAKGTRLVPITLNENFDLYGISVYCQNTIGSISVSLYHSNSPDETTQWTSSPKKCSRGENSFDVPPSLGLKKGEKVWVGIINDSDDTLFKTVKPVNDWYEISDNPGQDEMKFPDRLGKTKTIANDTIMIELIGKRRHIENENNMIQLSSETKSEDLPKHLEKLQEPLQVDALLTSPVFGTGIDVDRLGLMNVMTQPKTTSGYIQATGRVGRKTPGLILTWFSSRRARDLDHFENFVGYHRNIHSHVEPITASPFSVESLDLSLGPIMVSILRNGKKIQNTAISPDWISSAKGPLKILSHKHGSSPEIRSIREFLNSIGTNSIIPSYRMNDNFDDLAGIQINNWLSLAEDLSSKGEDFIYGERNPTRPVEKHVVLGSPFHEQRGFQAAFRNTRNSLRDTESTAMFYHQLDKITIRPSQFITRYGPGSLLPGDSCSVTSPSVEGMISDLREPIGNFSEVVQGKKELNKIEISDSRMIKMLRRFNKKIDLDEIHVFEMPTNESLNSKAHPVASFDNIYKSRLFPEWATCSKHSGDRILSKIVHHPISKKLVVKCPLCQTQFGDLYSTTFSSVRFVMACRNGHMSDVDWNKSVHKLTRCSSSDPDDHRVFIWDENGSGDDIGFNCYGVWTGGGDREVFKHTTCNASTTYSHIKRDSSLGTIECKRTFVENPDRPEKSCDASPKIARKSMMSLRSPIILSSLVIEQKKSLLLDKLFYHRRDFLIAKRSLDKKTKDWEVNELVEKLEEDQDINAIGNLLLQDIKNTPKDEILKVSEQLTKEIKRETSGETELTESQELEEELYNLENGIREGAKQTKVHGISKSSKRRFPVKWKSPKFGFHFEAMPYSDIRVTMVQTGYTREIIETLQEKDDETSKNLLQLRKGKMVSKFSRFDDPSNGHRWYLGNQSIGEGIFIHFDPDQKPNSLFPDQKTNINAWKDFHDQVMSHAEKKEKSNLTEEEKDIIESGKTRSNPLFVWWHTLAHQIVSELSVDSGFATTAIRERVYCKRNEDGSYSTGILIFVSSPGSDGTLGGLTSLASDNILPKIVEKSLEKLTVCSNDPVCSQRELNPQRYRGAACHACIMAPETSCSYQNKFLDRNLMRETLQ